MECYVGVRRLLRQLDGRSALMIPAMGQYLAFAASKPFQQAERPLLE
jgi:hypothetical protein